MESESPLEASPSQLPFTSSGSSVIVRSYARPCCSLLGYLSVVIGMMYELGLPWRIWHPIVMWNRRSVLFEVSCCVMLYTTVLSLEFSPSLVEKIP